MDLSSDSDDCQLYTRTAANVAKKKKLLDEDRHELALRMKYLPDDQVPGFSHVFDRLYDSLELEPPAVSVELLSASDSEDEIPLSLLRRFLVAGSKRNRRKATKLPNKKVKTFINSVASNNSDSRQPTSCGRRTISNKPNVNEIPTIILDDDTGYPTTLAPINFNSHSNKKRTEDDNNLDIALDKLQAIDDDETEEDLDTLVKISVDWKNNSGILGLNLKHFKLRRYQKFETIFEEFGKMEGLPINRIVIMRQFETIRPRDTPASLNLTYYGHFVGMISKTEVDHSLPKPSELNDDYKKPGPEGELNVKLLLDSKVSLSLTISKTQKMNILYKKCSEELNIPDSQIKISFDGEIVQGEDTVSDLGVEDGDVFDVLVKKG